MISTKSTCRNHPGVRATWMCESCGAAFCGECVVVREVRFTRIETCPQCEGRCDPVALAQQRRRRPFLSLLPGAFVYPIQKGGIIVVTAGTLLCLLLAWLLAQRVHLYGHRVRTG